MNKCYALFDQEGKMRRCGETLEIATNYFVQSMDVALWNKLFDANATRRRDIFREHGWQVLTGVFVPNSKD